jgi:ABC-type nitrate/sulfonate/bicarbonate transport system permease component
MIKSANATFNMPQLFARTLFIIIIGLVMVLVAEIVERRLLKRWGQAS